MSRLSLSLAPSLLAISLHDVEITDIAVRTDIIISPTPTANGGTTTATAATGTGLYEAVAVGNLPPDAIDSPSAVRCVLRIDGTNYTSSAYADEFCKFHDAIVATRRRESTAKRR